MVLQSVFFSCFSDSPRCFRICQTVHSRRRATEHLAGRLLQHLQSKSQENVAKGQEAEISWMIFTCKKKKKGEDSPVKRVCGSTFMTSAVTLTAELVWKEETEVNKTSKHHVVCGYLGQIDHVVSESDCEIICVCLFTPKQPNSLVYCALAVRRESNITHWEFVCEPLTELSTQ